MNPNQPEVPQELHAHEAVAPFLPEEGEPTLPRIHEVSAAPESPSSEQVAVGGLGRVIQWYHDRIEEGKAAYRDARQQIEEIRHPQAPDPAELQRLEEEATKDEISMNIGLLGRMIGATAWALAGHIPKAVKTLFGNDD